MNPASELPTCETADAVLGDAARLRRVADDAERGILMRAVQWADLHPAPEGDDPAPGARDEARGRESDAYSARPAADRKSVVMAKMSSVRVDLGGRRINKKKK